MTLIERLLAQANKESNELADLLNEAAEALETNSEDVSAMAQPQQEPVALVTAAQKVMDEFGTSSDGLQELYQALKLYTSPPTRQPLTVEQIEEVWMAYEKARPKNSSNPESRIQFARAIEAAHGIKDTHE